MREFWDAVFADTTDTPLKCPECNGNMEVVEWSMDEKKIWFECSNGHYWTKERMKK